MTTTVTLHLYDCDHEPNLPRYVSRNPTWIGHIIEHIHAANAKGLIKKVLIHALALFVSFVLCLSIIGIPLFIYGFKEHIIQAEENRLIQYREHLYTVCTELNKAKFFRGRIVPLESMEVSLKPAIRKKIIHDLEEELNGADASKFSDKDLFLMAANKYENFLERCELKFCSK